MTSLPSPPSPPSPPSLAPAPSPSPSPVPIGSPAPDFTLPDHHGAEYSLTAHRTRTNHPTLLVFYPYAFSRICGGELRELQSALPDLEHHNTTLLTISCDPMYALRVYAEQEAFAFPLLSDFWPHGAIARAYGVFDETKGCARRGSFLIDQEGIVRWSIVNPIHEARPLTTYLSALTNTPH